MDIQVVIASCNALTTFQEPEIALEFLKMLLGLIQPEQFLSFIHLTATNPGADDMAKELVMRCMGVPA